MKDPNAIALAVKEHIQGQDRYGRLTGVEILEVKPGYARGQLLLREEHMNSVDSAHGGAIFTLADILFAAACNSHGLISVGANVSISYTRSAERGALLTAEAVENHGGRRLGHYTVTVRDEKKRLVALFQGMAYRLDKPLVDLHGND